MQTSHGGHHRPKVFSTLVISVVRSPDAVTASDNVHPNGYADERIPENKDQTNLNNNMRSSVLHHTYGKHTPQQPKGA